MKIDIEAIKQARAAEAAGQAVAEPTKKPKEKRLKKFLTQDVLINDKDIEEDVLETVEDIEAEKALSVEKGKPSRTKSFVMMGLGYSLAIGLATAGSTYWINQDGPKLDISPIVDIANENHRSILNGSPDDFDRLIAIYNRGESGDITIDAPEVSDAAYEARIANLQEEIRTLKDDLAKALEAESDPNVIPDRPETVVVEVPSVDKTNEEIINLKAKLAASEAREKNLQQKLNAMKP